MAEPGLVGGTGAHCTDLDVSGTQPWAPWARPPPAHPASQRYHKAPTEGSPKRWGLFALWSLPWAAKSQEGPLLGLPPSWAELKLLQKDGQPRSLILSADIYGNLPCQKMGITGGINREAPSL